MSKNPRRFAEPVRLIVSVEAEVVAVAVEVSAEIQGTGQLLPHRPRGAECLAAGIFSALPGRQQQPSQTRMVERFRGVEGGESWESNRGGFEGITKATACWHCCPAWPQGRGGANPWSAKGRTPPPQAYFHTREIRNLFWRFRPCPP